MTEITPKQRDLARHALGLPNDRNLSYRNHFVTGPGSDDFKHWNALVDTGFAMRRGPVAIYRGDYLFTLTTHGAKTALNEGEHLDPEDFPEGGAL